VVSVHRIVSTLYDLIFRGKIEDATSCRARRLVVATLPLFFVNVTSTTCFDLIKSSSGR
jgi:hypothetical protein